MEANGHSQSHGLLVLHHQPPSNPTQPAAMTFNGTWKVDRSENYDKFMEQMGECV